jgi:hypothetical protein
LGIWQARIMYGAESGAESNKVKSPLQCSRDVIHFLFQIKN